MNRRVIRVGSRGSVLALAQAQEVVRRLSCVDTRFEWDIVPIRTTGDRLKEDVATPFERGMFVKDIEEALLRGEIDLAVHSLKDLPTELPSGLTLFAVLERNDPREVLLSREGLRFSALPKGVTVGTSSARRKVQIEWLRPDLRVVTLRGNVLTRIHKMEVGQVEALILAAAGLKRLGQSERIVEYFPPEVFVPAVGQGVVAVEGRIDDPLQAIVEKINHRETWYAVETEREFLRCCGGGCRTPVGALATVKEDCVCLLGMIAFDGLVKKVSWEGSVERRHELARSLVEYLRGGHRG